VIASALTTLSQTDRPPTTRALLFLGLIVAGALLAFMVLQWVRKRLLSRTPYDGGGLGFALHELGDLKRGGGLSEEEYAALRRALLGRESGVEAERRVVNRAEADASGAGAVEAASRSEEEASGAVSEREKRARPGYDLTGEPLPGADAPSPEEPGDGEADARSDDRSE